MPHHLGTLSRSSLFSGTQRLHPHAAQWIAVRVHLCLQVPQGPRSLNSYLFILTAYVLHLSIQCYIVLLHSFVSGFQILRRTSTSHLSILAFSACHVLRTEHVPNKCFLKGREKEERGKNQYELSKYNKTMEIIDGVKLDFSSKPCYSLAGWLWPNHSIFTNRKQTIPATKGYDRSWGENPQYSAWSMMNTQ